MTLEKLKEKYGEVISIHTPTREVWDKVVGKLLSIGLVWKSGNSELKSSKWNVHKTRTDISINYCGRDKLSFGICGENYISVEEFLSNFEKVKIIAGVNKIYEIGDYKVSWSYGEDYLRDEDFSKLDVINKGETYIMEFKIVTPSSITGTNKILEALDINAEIVEPPKTIKLKSEDGQEIEVDIDKAKELGIVV